MVVCSVFTPKQLNGLRLKFKSRQASNFTKLTFHIVERKYIDQVNVEMLLYVWCRMFFPTREETKDWPRRLPQCELPLFVIAFGKTRRDTFRYWNTNEICFCPCDLIEATITMIVIVIILKSCECLWELGRFYSRKSWKCYIFLNK